MITATAGLPCSLEGYERLYPESLPLLRAAYARLPLLQFSRLVTLSESSSAGDDFVAGASLYYPTTSDGQTWFYALVFEYNEQSALVVLFPFEGPPAQDVEIYSRGKIPGDIIEHVARALAATLENEWRKRQHMLRCVGRFR